MRKINKYIRRVIGYLKKQLFFLKVLTRTKNKPDRDKVVFLSIENIRLDRYLANLITFFKLNNFTIYLPRDKNLINKIYSKKGEAKYMYLVLDGYVKFGTPNKALEILYFNKNQLSNNYYRGNQSANSYFVPMSEYPLMYSNYSSKQLIKTKELRNCSVFMSGNFTKESYNKISHDNIFDVLSRRAVYDYIIKQAYFKKLKNLKELTIPSEKITNKKVYLVDTHNDFSIELNSLKSILIKFDFYMALPGVVIPQSHNLVEAMSVGCIPIIHKTYANLYIPKLEHMKNCMVYSTFDDLNIIISKAFNLEKEQIVFLRAHVLHYYKQFLSPKEVIKNVTKAGIKKLYIQAEQESVRLLKLNIKK